MSKDKQSDRRAAELNKKNLTRANLSRQSLGGANLARAFTDKMPKSGSY
jgi:uncharacterized protein YjbI with pentapeptide repeats